MAAKKIYELEVYELDIHPYGDKITLLIGDDKQINDYLDDKCPQISDRARPRVLENGGSHHGMHIRIYVDESLIWLTEKSLHSFNHEVLHAVIWIMERCSIPIQSDYSEAFVCLYCDTIKRFKEMMQNKGRKFVE